MQTSPENTIEIAVPSKSTAVWPHSMQECLWLMPGLADLRGFPFGSASEPGDWTALKHILACNNMMESSCYCVPSMSGNME